MEQNVSSGRLTTLIHISLLSLSTTSKPPVEAQSRPSRHGQESLHDQDIARCSMVRFDLSFFSP